MKRKTLGDTGIVLSNPEDVRRGKAEVVTDADKDRALAAFLRVKLEKQSEDRRAKVASLADGIEAERLGLGRVYCRGGRWTWEWAK